MSLFISQIATVDIGPDLTSCSSSEISLNNAIAENYSNLVWTTSGDGNFNNSNILNPTYFPGPGDIGSGSILITLEATSESPCTESTIDTLVITFTEGPTVDAGLDQAICEGSFTVNGASATNYQSLQWSIIQGSGTLLQGDTLNPIYTTSPSDVVSGQVVLRLTVTGVSPCDDTIFDEVIFTIQQLPSVFAGSDVQICEGSEYTFVNGATSENTDTLLWSHNGLGNLLNPTTLTPTYITAPGEQGVIEFTLTGSGIPPCSGTIQDSFDLEIIPNGDIFAGEDVVICDSTYQLDATGTNITNIVWSSTGTRHI